MSFLHEVEVRDQVDVSDEVERTPSRIDIILADVIAITDQVVLPRMLAIIEVEPARLRGNITATIRGQGFATSVAGNRVTFNGFAGTVLTASEDELTVTTPSFLDFTENGYASVEVESPAFSQLKGRAQVWTKWSTVEEEADDVLPLQRASFGEDTGEDRPRIAEAEDYNRLLTIVEHAVQGGAERLGDGFKVRGESGLVGVDRRNLPQALTATAGEGLVVDHSQEGLLAFGWQLDETLAYGGSFQSFNSGPANLLANADRNDLLGSLDDHEHIAMLDGTINAIWFLVECAGADFVTSTELFVDGVSAFSSGDNFSNGQVAAFRVNVPVNRGQTIELQVNKSGATTLLSCTGGVRVRYR